MVQETGSTSGLDRATWLRLAEYARLLSRIADSPLDLPSTHLERSLGLVERRFLPETMKVDYAALLRERAAWLRRETGFWLG